MKTVSLTTHQPRHPLMKCGHAANATNGRGLPSCAICAGLTPDAEQIAETPDLTGRMASCFTQRCKSFVPSSLDLPFFEYRPDKAEDKFYCGCLGWD